MSARRMSVKLMPKLASTGPSVNARNSSVNGSASTQAASACWRRVGSTCRLAEEPPPDRGWWPRSGEETLVSRLMSESGADRRGLLLHGGHGVGRVGVALGGLLDLAVDRRGHLFPRRHGRRGEGALELLAEDLQLGVVGELAGVPGGLDGREVADLVVERLLGLGLAQPLDELPGAVRVVGVAEDGQVATTGERRAGGAVLAGQRHDGVLVLLDAGVLDQARVPRTGDERAARAVGEPALEFTRVAQGRRGLAVVEER